jgi:hypothetical protein
MVNSIYIVVVIEILVFSLILLFTSVYSLLILLVRRFHHRNHMFILNICFNIINAAIFFIIFYTLSYFDPSHLFVPNMCIFLFYAFNVVSIGIPFAFIAFTVHRLCSLVYRRINFFKTKRWVMVCIVSQWIGIFVISLPFVFRKEKVSILN